MATTRTHHLGLCANQYNYANAGTIDKVASVVPAIRAVNGVQTLVTFGFRMPKDWDGGNFSIKFGCFSVGTAGNIVLAYSVVTQKDGEVPSQIVNINQTKASPAVNTKFFVDSYTVTGTLVESDDFLWLTVGRLADSGSDTMEDQMHLGSVTIEYTTRNVTYVHSPNTKIKSSEINQNYVDLR